MYQCQKIIKFDISYLPTAFNRVMCCLKESLAEYSFNTSLKQSQQTLSNGALKKELANYFTEIDKAVNPEFRFQYKGQKEVFSLNQRMVIEVNEIKTNFIEEVKVDLKNQIIMEQRLDSELLTIDSNPNVIKMTVENCPSMLIFWIRNESSLDSSVVEFNLSQLWDEAINPDVAYELISILSYNANERSFEIINKIGRRIFYIASTIPITSLIYSP